LPLAIPWPPFDDYRQNFDPPMRKIGSVEREPALF
jgi:hypothetical protein